MAKIIINKSRPLKGSVKINGAKNSVLPIIAASLLTNGSCTLEGIPYLEDVKIMSQLIESLGCKTEYDESSSKMNIIVNNIIGTAPYDLVNKMRASFLVMGPVLSRLGYAKIPFPGGCAIGTRPIDLHLKGLMALGAKINLGHGFVEASAKKLKGAKIYLDFPSVGATENIIMAATMAEGTTIIENSATEPEIVDLSTFLNSMGAKISGAGTDTIIINGVKELQASTHSIIPDRIEAGTYMIAAAITRGEVLLENVITDHLKPISAKLKEAGVEISEELSSLKVNAKKRAKAIDIKTLPYPGFPTDMQAQAMALMSIAEGTSVIIETMFENRFMHVCELNRMGANIKVEGRTAVVDGCEKLTGAQVKATDLRAGASLILAGLIADGPTEVENVEHIDRGYYKLEENLSRLGVDIKRIED